MAMCRGSRANVLVVTALLGWIANVAPANADGAARDLSGYTTPGVPFTVSISIDPPEVIYACGVEEKPPTGWTVSNISNSGAWDAQTRKVKWGPFFAPSIPASVVYDITSPVGASGRFCFSGKVVFDGLEQLIGGDDCLAVTVPALSAWGMMALAMLILAAGTVRAKQRGCPTPSRSAGRGMD